MIDFSSLGRQARRSEVLLVLLAVLLLAVMAVRLAIELIQPTQAGDLLGHPAPAAGWRAWQAGILTALGMVQTALWLGAVVALARVFAGLRRALGTPQTAALAPIVVSARSTSRWLWGALVWSVLSQPLASLVATWTAPAGERTLSIAFGTTQLVTLLVVLLAGFMAQALRLLAELWQDHREIV